MSTPEERHGGAYWAKSMRVVLAVLVLWFCASYGCGIVFREWLDENMMHVGNAPFGFWMAQQGSIIIFLILLIAYTQVMNRLDRAYDFEEVKS